MSSPNKSFFPLIVAVVLGLSSAVESLHLVNLTSLTACDDPGMDPAGYITESRPEINPDNGLIVAFHAKFNFTRVLSGPRTLRMTFFKCAKDTMGPCNENPTVHEEVLDCLRFTEDASGPWHMFSTAMSGSKCGDVVGQFTLDFSALKIDHLVKYLDVDDEQFRRFRLKTHFIDIDSGDDVGCNDIQFDLLKVVT